MAMSAEVLTVTMTDKLILKLREFETRHGCRPSVIHITKSELKLVREEWNGLLDDGHAMTYDGPSASINFFGIPLIVIDE